MQAKESVSELRADGVIKANDDVPDDAEEVSQRVLPLNSLARRMLHGRLMPRGQRAGAATATQSAGSAARLECAPMCKVGRPFGL